MTDMPTPREMAIRDVVAAQLDDRYRDWEPTEYTRREPDGALSLAYRYAATPYDQLLEALAPHRLSAPAACAEADPDLWFSEQPGERELAARICSGCPARAECETWGEAEQWGVWGGVDRHEPTRELNRKSRALRLLGRGVSRGDVAVRVGVSLRTIERWAA